MRLKTDADFLTGITNEKFNQFRNEENEKPGKSQHVLKIAPNSVNFISKSSGISSSKDKMEVFDADEG